MLQVAKSAQQVIAPRFILFAWGLSFLVAILAFIAWSQGLRWQFSNLSTYRIFPIFGLMAFSLIWSMYIVGFMRKRLKLSIDSLNSYYRILPLLILIFIMLHPGLLIWQLWRDGFGLPPESYLQHYVAPSLRWAALIGTTALLIFIAYELRYMFRERNWWKYIEALADLAFIGLFFHALALGGQLQRGWFRYVWFFYGFALVIVLIDSYIAKITRLKNSH